MYRVENVKWPAPEDLTIRCRQDEDAKAIAVLKSADGEVWSIIDEARDPEACIALAYQQQVYQAER